MPTLDRISGARIGGQVEAAGVRLVVERTPNEDNRDMPAPPNVLPLLKQAKLRVPPKDQTYEPRSLDEALSAGGLSTDQCLFLKSWLNKQGLLADR
jgi:hypothetical protein